MTRAEEREREGRVVVGVVGEALVVVAVAVAASWRRYSTDRAGAREFGGSDIAAARSPKSPRAIGPPSGLQRRGSFAGGAPSIPDMARGENAVVAMELVRNQAPLPCAAGSDSR